jgi:hypothetical protein
MSTIIPNLASAALPLASLSFRRISPHDFWALLSTFAPEAFAADQWLSPGRRESWAIFQLDRGLGVATSIIDSGGERSIHHFLYERHL